MARKPDPKVTVHDEANLIQGVAKHFLRKVYGPEGMPWGTKFSELEELAVQIGRARLAEFDGPRRWPTRPGRYPRRRRIAGSVAGRCNPAPHPSRGP